MLVALTIIEIKYLLINLFCDMLPLSNLYWPAIYIYIYIRGIKFFVVVVVVVINPSSSSELGCGTNDNSGSCRQPN